MTRTSWLLFALTLTPALAFGQGGPGDMMLGEPEEQELRSFEGVVRKDANTGRFVVKERGARFALPDAASALRGRRVRVQGVVGESLARSTYDLSDLTWIEPQPQGRQGTLVAEDGQAMLISGEERIRLVPPAGLNQNALLFLTGRAQVPVSGFLFPHEEGDELVVTGISARIGDLARGDEAYLSQRVRVEGESGPDGARYDFQNALDRQGQRQRLAGGTLVKVTDLEIYRVADREVETVGRFRELPSGFSLEDLAEDERLFVYVVRLDRAREAGDARSEGWVPVRKVVIGEALPEPVVADAAGPEGEDSGGSGLADVVQELEQQAEQPSAGDMPAEGTPTEVSATDLLLRESPGGKKLAVMFNGLELEMTGEREGDWLGVRMLEPLDGWVDSRHLEIDGDHAVVTASRLNLRAQASTRSERQLVLAEGLQLEIAERRGMWARVQTAVPLEGFAHESLLTH